MRPLVRTSFWIGCLAAASFVVGGGRGDPPSPSGGDPDGARAGVLPSRKTELRVPPARDRASWRIHPEILSAPEAASLGGGWVVLDTRTSTLHFLDEDLELVRSVGGAGRGPGELWHPRELAVLGDSLVAVLDGLGARIDLFSPGGDARGRLTPRVAGCPVGLSRDLVPDPAGGLVLQGVCGATEPRWTAARVALDGTGSVIASAPLSAGGSVAPPLGRAVIAWRGGLWTGGPDGCFVALAAAGGAEPERACLPDEPPVPVPDSLRENVDPPLALPETWPPFVAASWSAAGPVLALPGGGPDGTRALLRADGSLLVIESADRVAVGRSGLLLNRTFLDGTGFRSVPWTEPDLAARRPPGREPQGHPRDGDAP